MRQDRPLHAVKRGATRDKNDSAKYKTVKRKKGLKTSSWYESAASSIKAARASLGVKADMRSCTPSQLMATF